MGEQVVVRGSEEGRTLLIGGGDFVTYRASSAETGGAYFCFEASTMPGFGPPLHCHPYRELFYVLEGSYEFTFERDGRMETVVGAAGTSVAVPPGVPHTFRNATDEPARLLFVHQPAALEAFFDEVGVPVPAPGAMPDDLAPPDFPAFAAALQRNGVEIVRTPRPRPSRS